MSELKPCPFCGGPATYSETRVECHWCGCTLDGGPFHDGYENESQAIDAWNIRVPTSAAPDLLRVAQIAEQFMSIATDWNFDECEIDGKMRRTHALLKEVRAAIAKATPADGEQ